MNRRDFLKNTAAIAGVEASGADTSPIPRRLLGKTGEYLSIIGLGGIALMGMPQDEANSTVANAIARGVNYFDVAPSYGEGEAEEKLGPALQPHREQAFLACKTAVRDKEGAKRELHASLKRLRTDRFDLYQLHGLTTMDEVDKALGPGGAMEAFIEAREQGRIRFLGFSAHSEDAAIAAMNRFPFDTILFPFNWVCFFQSNFGLQVLKLAKEKNVGCLALKAMARSPWPEDAAHEYLHCWYQPISDPEEAALALRFTLSQPITAALPPGDVRLFEMALKTAQNFIPLTQPELVALQKRSDGITPIFPNA